MGRRRCRSRGVRPHLPNEGPFMWIVVHSCHEPCRRPVLLSRSPPFLHAFSMAGPVSVLRAYLPGQFTVPLADFQVCPFEGYMSDKTSLLGARSRCALEGSWGLLGGSTAAGTVEGGQEFGEKGYVRGGPPRSGWARIWCLWTHLASTPDKEFGEFQ